MKLSDNDFYLAILNAIPSPVFVVDSGVRVAALNDAASAMLERDKADVLGLCGGELFHCLGSSESEASCGHSAHCKKCVIRNSVTLCLQGQVVRRLRTTLDFLPATGLAALELLVTASPVPGVAGMALLMVEDVTPITDAKSVVSMCMKCRRIRGSEPRWESVEQYFRAQAGIDFSPGVCPACVDRMEVEQRS